MEVRALGNERCSSLVPHAINGFCGLTYLCSKRLAQQFIFSAAWTGTPWHESTESLLPSISRS
jgi:hypothetical protein